MMPKFGNTFSRFAYLSPTSIVQNFSSFFQEFYLIPAQSDRGAYFCWCDCLNSLCNKLSAMKFRGASDKEIHH